MNKQIKTSALLGVCIVSLGSVAALIAYNNAAGRGVIIAFAGLYPKGTPHWITSQ